MGEVCAYYNEWDAYAAAWLRNLIAARLLPAGDVDERSIADVQPGDLAGYTQCHFFAGIGGWAYAARLAGWADDRPLWTGSCPCQPFSVAGAGKGAADERHLWPEFSRLIAARRPPVVMGEQVAAAVGKDWLDGVFADLEGHGYACRAAVVPACAVDAPHRRDRLWFVADTYGDRPQGAEPSLAAGFGRRLADAGGAGGGLVAHTHRFVRKVDQDTGGGADGGGARKVAGPCGPRDGFVADAYQPCSREGREQRGRELGGAGGDPGARPGGGAGGEAVADACRQGLPLPERPGRGEPPGPGHNSASFGAAASERGGDRPWAGAGWLRGADGKARRIEPGIRLLAHGVPGRVGQLRALGNAIVPQVAAEVIAAFMEAHPHAP